MAGLIRKSLDSPEEVRKFEAGTGHLELVNLDAGPVGRATFQPGWRWSLHVKPIANTGSCQAAHTGYSHVRPKILAIITRLSCVIRPKGLGDLRSPA